MTQQIISSRLGVPYKVSTYICLLTLATKLIFSGKRVNIARGWSQRGFYGYQEIDQQITHTHIIYIQQRES